MSSENPILKWWLRFVNRFSTSTGVMRQEFYVILVLLLGLLIGTSVKLFFDFESKREMAVKMQAEFFDTGDEDSLLADAMGKPVVEQDTLASNEDVKTNKVYTAKVNINTATQEQMEEIPEIGPTLADRIIRYRKALGGFKRLDELLSLKGISERKFKKIQPFLTLGKAGKP